VCQQKLVDTLLLVKEYQITVSASDISTVCCCAVLSAVPASRALPQHCAPLLVNITIILPLQGVQLYGRVHGHLHQKVSRRSPEQTKLLLACNCIEGYAACRTSHHSKAIFKLQLKLLSWRMVVVRHQTTHPPQYAVTACCCAISVDATSLCCISPFAHDAVLPALHVKEGGSAGGHKHMRLADAADSRYDSMITMQQV
jgi:hypothetical protein